jgi:hypothetical protein
MNWRQWLLELLCRLYKEWGGTDCDDFNQDPYQAISVLVAKYQNDGPPEPADPVKYHQLLDAIDAHLASPDNDLSPQANATLKQLIAELRNAK